MASILCGCSVGASLWLHRAGELFHRHLSAKHNICSIMSQWTEVISVLRWVWETSLKLEFKASLSLCPRRLLSGIRFRSRNNDEKISRRRQRRFKYHHKLQVLSLQCHTKLSLFDPKTKIGFKKVCGITVTCSQCFQKQPWFGSSREKRSVQAEPQSDLFGAPATRVWSVLELVCHFHHFPSQKVF